MNLSDSYYIRKYLVEIKYAIIYNDLETAVCSLNKLSFFLYKRDYYKTPKTTVTENLIREQYFHEGKQFIEVRDYLVQRGETIYKRTLNKGVGTFYEIEKLPVFLRWVDNNWRKIEI